MTYTFTDFQTTPLKFASILAMRIEKNINDHSVMILKGQIDEDEKDNIAEKATIGETIAFYAGDICIFSGIITKVSLSVANNVRIATLEAYSYTLLMDVKRVNRSFQQESMTYSDLISYVTEPYATNGVIDAVTNGKEKDVLLIQYNETDWAFLKRVATHFNTYLVPSDKYGALRYTFGKPMGSSAPLLESENYTVEKNLLCSNIKMANGLYSFDENNALTIDIESEDIFELGQDVLFNGAMYEVFKIVTRIESAILVHTYSLCNAAGLVVPKQYNQRFCGLSLFGNVLDVANDKIKVKLDIDANNTAAGDRWFAYSTVYSSPDGSGWYAMPEKGDYIRLALPDEDENNAYAASAVDLESSNPEMRADPDNKTLHTVHGKSLSFQPGGIYMNAGNGIAVDMDNEKGIALRSSKGVTITSSKDITILSKSSSVKIIAADKVLLEASAATAEIGEDVIFKGDKVKIGE